jgi:hypothetical protein
MSDVEKRVYSELRKGTWTNPDYLTWKLKLPKESIEAALASLSQRNDNIAKYVQEMNKELVHLPDDEWVTKEWFDKQEKATQEMMLKRGFSAVFEKLPDGSVVSKKDMQALPSEVQKVLREQGLEAGQKAWEKWQRQRVEMEQETSRQIFRNEMHRLYAYYLADDDIMARLPYVKGEDVLGEIEKENIDWKWGESYEAMEGAKRIVDRLYEASREGKASHLGKEERAEHGRELLLSVLEKVHGTGDEKVIQKLVNRAAWQVWKERAEKYFMAGGGYHSLSLPGGDLPQPGVMVSTNYGVFPLQALQAVLDERLARGNKGLWVSAWDWLRGSLSRGKWLRGERGLSIDSKVLLRAKSALPPWTLLAAGEELLSTSTSPPASARRLMT